MFACTVYHSARLKRSALVIVVSGDATRRCYLDALASLANGPLAAAQFRARRASGEWMSFWLLEMVAVLGSAEVLADMGFFTSCSVLLHPIECWVRQCS
jgi:hypothetical protein